MRACYILSPETNIDNATLSKINPNITQSSTLFLSSLFLKIIDSGTSSKIAVTDDRLLKIVKTSLPNRQEIHVRAAPTKMAISQILRAVLPILSLFILLYRGFLPDSPFFFVLSYIPFIITYYNSAFYYTIFFLGFQYIPIKIHKNFLI